LWLNRPVMQDVLQRRRLLLLVGLLVFGPLRAFAAATAAESDSFDSDEALDWIGLCLRSPGTVAVAKTLELSLKPGTLEAADASAAVAAAEVVAAALGHPNAKMPQELGTWLAAQKQGDVVKLKPVAARAVERILNGKGSELQAQWKESKDFEAWQAHMRDLQERLR